MSRAYIHPVEKVLVAPVLPEAAHLTLAAALDVEAGGALGVVALTADEGLHPVVRDERDVVSVVLGAGVLDPGEVGGGELLPWRVLHWEVAHRLQDLLLHLLPHLFFILGVSSAPTVWDHRSSGFCPAAHAGQAARSGDGRGGRAAQGRRARRSTAAGPAARGGEEARRWGPVARVGSARRGARRGGGGARGVVGGSQAVVGERS